MCLKRVLKLSSPQVTEIMKRVEAFEIGSFVPNRCEKVESDTDNNLQFKFDDSQNEENYLPYNSDVDLKSYATPTKSKTQLSQDTTKLLLDGYRKSTLKLKNKNTSLEKEIELLEWKGSSNSKIVDQLGIRIQNFAFFVSPVSNGEIKYTIEPEDECFDYYRVIIDEMENNKTYQQIYLLKKCVDYEPPSIVFYGKKKLFK
ncbi:hypothetical protein ACTFIW_008750 [Dictyostelium discoideum]